MKTLTDIARGIAHQAEQTPNADIDELEVALFEATEMILYRVDCLLHPEAGFECPKE